MHVNQKSPFTTSPLLRVTSAASTPMFVPALRKRTEPSPNSALVPPVWNA